MQEHYRARRRIRRVGDSRQAPAVSPDRGGRNATAGASA
jgi:hypothetical protein